MPGVCYGLGIVCDTWVYTGNMVAWCRKYGFIMKREWRMGMRFVYMNSKCGHDKHLQSF